MKKKIQKGAIAETVSLQYGNINFLFLKIRNKNSEVLKPDFCQDVLSKEVLLSCQACNLLPNFKFAAFHFFKV